ncbi:NnrS family protein [Paucibacter sp. KBW04]|uniref:NnrS family protein n=1 Tax=Paucibacter sp. KBW04 TaxID=2153361 RepID=UPI000F57D028|nr:NnrS family protein [Paucibacter sp. KBW04]RQO56907.1 NnrS family protein [Paucibacter sp. KBW04]
MSQFIKIEEPLRPSPRAAQTSQPLPATGLFGGALWRLGFRPFYLLASGFAALSIALWALQFMGWLHGAYLQGPLWHAHEMLFGYTLAVLVGFLLTAGRNWSNRPTLAGPALAGLALLWLAGRVLVLTPYAWAAALVNTAFPLCAAVALALPFIAARNRRNYFFIALLGLLGLAQLSLHLAQLGVIQIPPWAGLQLGLDVLLFILAVMAGRVIPMFTNNGVRGAKAQKLPWLERLALGSVLALLAADLLRLPASVLSALLLLAAGAHLARWLLWQPWATWRAPLVWVLHLAYLWIPIHLLLRAGAEIAGWPASAATHALTVGAIGSLTLGMMSRTARGHTGLSLQAGRAELIAFVLLALAAPLRVFLPLFAPALLPLSVGLAAGLWSTAFALYFIRFWPVLTRPRVDGKPG